MFNTVGLLIGVDIEPYPLLLFRLAASPSLFREVRLFAYQLDVRIIDKLAPIILSTTLIS